MLEEQAAPEPMMMVPITTTTEAPAVQEETTVQPEATPDEVEIIFPKYQYNYEVHDEKTGDIKRQHESVENGKVTGQYSLIDADGYRRIVEYTADDVNGFQATVRREQTDYKMPVQEQRAEEIQQSTEQAQAQEPEVQAAQEPAAEAEAAMPEQQQEQQMMMEQPAQMEQQQPEQQAETFKPYNFRYEVHSANTGDIKRQHESSENGQVKGQYSLIDSDGYRRVVQYTADAMNGFQAMVRREPYTYQPQQAAAVAPEATLIVEQSEDMNTMSMMPRNYIRWW